MADCIPNFEIRTGSLCRPFHGMALRCRAPQLWGLTHLRATTCNGSTDRPNVFATSIFSACGAMTCHVLLLPLQKKIRVLLKIYHTTLVKSLLNHTRLAGHLNSMTNSLLESVPALNFSTGNKSLTHTHALLLRLLLSTCDVECIAHAKTQTKQMKRMTNLYIYMSLYV